MAALALLVIFFLAMLSFLGWLYILLHPARPWDFQPVGDDGPIPDLAAVVVLPPVCVIVPARNEAESLPRTLPALLSQDYPAEFQVIVVDDRSEDGTAEVAKKLAAELNVPERLTVVQGKPLPEGWTGKVWALDQGARVEEAAHAEFVLLTDADILHAPQSVRRLVAESLAAGIGMNSRMARLRCESPAEHLLIPAFVYFFNLLYPMRKVNDPHDRLAGAAGGCVLLSAEALRRMDGGFESIKSEIIDDVNLARQVKRAAGLPLFLALSRTEVTSLRDYPQLIDIWKMVRRTAFTELQYRWSRLVGAVAGLALMFVVPVFALLMGLFAFIATSDPQIRAYAVMTFGKGLLSLLLMRFVYAPAIRFFKLPGRWAWTLPAAAVLYGLMTIDSALRHARKARTEWREIAPSKPLQS